MPLSVDIAYSESGPQVVLIPWLVSAPNMAAGYETSVGDSVADDHLFQL
jgi:hypothetical protein